MPVNAMGRQVLSHPPARYLSTLRGVFEMNSSLRLALRICNGQPCTRDIFVTCQDTGAGLPVLHVFADWSPRNCDWLTRDRFEVEEIPSSLDGRAFLLHRSDEAKAKDMAAGREPEGRYAVLIARNGQDHVCECRGFAAHGRCKHLTALRGLLEAGHIDNPADAGPVEFPTPEQVEHDAEFDGHPCGQQFPDEPPADESADFDVDARPEESAA